MEIPHKRIFFKSILTAMACCLLAVIMIVGCTRTIYQPVQIERVQADSVNTKADSTLADFHSMLKELRQSVNVRDSVVIRDSVIMVVNDVGNVISKETFHNRDRSYSKDESVLQMQAKYDSIFKAQRNEFNAIIKRLEQTPVPIEKELSAWEKLKQEAGSIAIGLTIAIIVIAVSWLIKKIKNK